MNEKKYMTFSAILRNRKRYIIYQVFSHESNIENSHIESAIWRSLKSYLGVKALSNAKIKVLKELYDPQQRIGVIRCDHAFVGHVRAALCLIDKINAYDGKIDTWYVSGTLKKIKMKIKVIQNANNDT